MRALLACLFLLLVSGCMVGPPDHLTVGAGHDEVNGEWKETVSLSFPISYGHDRPRDNGVPPR